MEFRAQPFNFAVLGGNLITEFVQHLVNLVHAVTPQPKGKADPVDVGGQGFGGKKHRRQRGDRLVESVQKRGAAGPPTPKNTRREIGSEEECGTDQRDGEEYQEETHRIHRARRRRSRYSGRWLPFGPPLLLLVPGAGRMAPWMTRSTACAGSSTT